MEEGNLGGEAKLYYTFCISAWLGTGSKSEGEIAKIRNHVLLNCLWYVKTVTIICDCGSGYSVDLMSGALHLGIDVSSTHRHRLPRYLVLCIIDDFDAVHIVSKTLPASLTYLVSLPTGQYHVP